MSKALRAGLASRLAWLATDDQSKAFELTLEKIAVGTRRPGNRTKKSGAGVQTGRAFAFVEEGAWGGLDFLAADAMVAEYEPRDRMAWLKDDADTRTDGVKAWVQDGEAKNFRLAKPLEGVLTRSSKIGPGFEFEQVLFLNRAHLIAHHREEDPPINSSPIADPGMGAGDWEAGLHSLTRVRPWVDSFCSSRSTSSADPDEPLYSALLNFTKSAGDNTGWGGAHFDVADAVLSAEAFGFAHPADDGNHDIGSPLGGKIMEGGLHIRRLKFGATDDGVIYSPAEFVNKQWRNGAKGPFFLRIEWREDFNATHGTQCGEAQGEKKWMGWSEFRDYEDPPRDIDTGGIKDTGGDKDNGGVKTPYDPGGPKITVPRMATTPKEIESPSAYGHPRPDGPDKPAQPGEGAISDGEDFRGVPWGGASDKGPQYALAQEIDDIWQSQMGFSESKFLAQPLTGHLMAGAVYENSTADEGRQDRWRPVKSQLEEVALDEFGMVLSRPAPAIGPGHYTFAGADVILSDLYTTINEAPADDFNDFSLGVFASPSADGRFGMGGRLPDSPFFQRGFDVALDFSSDADNPDILITGRNATGAQSTGTLKYNGVAVGTGSGDLLANGSVPMTDTLVLNTNGEPIVQAQALSGEPSSPATGDVYLDDGTNTDHGNIGFRRYNGADWDDLGAAGTGDFFADGSVKMTGTLDTDGNDIDYGGGDILDAGSIARNGLIDDKGQARAYRNSSAQTLSSATWTKVQLNAESFDVDSWFDSATNYRYTPQAAGKYRCSARLLSDITGDGLIGSPAARAVNIAIYKNGSVHAYGMAGFTGGDGETTLVAAQVADEIDMNGSTDYLEIYAILAGGGDITAGTAETYASFERVD